MTSVTTTTILEPSVGDLPSDGKGRLPLGDSPGSRRADDSSPSRWSPKSSLRVALARPTTWVVAIACAVGAVIRLDVPRGIWLDEAISIHDAGLGYGRMIHTLASTDVHPPLYFTILWGWVRMAGFGDFAVRVPSIVIGVLLIPMVYLLGKEAYDRRSGAVAAVLVAVAPLLVWYSQETRMYMLLMLWGTMALWAQLRCLARGGWFPWTLYAIASIGLMWTQYFGLWQLVFQQLVFVAAILVRWRRARPVRRLVTGWAVTVGAIGVAVVPVVVLAHEQFSVHQATGQAFGVATQGAHPDIYSVLANLAWAVLGYHSNADMAVLVALWPVGMLFLLALLGRPPRKVTLVLVGAAASPLVMMYLLGQFKQSLFDIRYMSTMVPILFVLIGRGISGVMTTRRSLSIATAVVVMIMLVALFDQQFSSSNPRRYDFRETLQLVDHQFRPGDVILYRPVDLWSVVRYYSPHLAASPLTSTPTLPTDGHELFVVSSGSLMNGTTDNVTLDRALADLGARCRLVERRRFPNVQLSVYR